MGIRSNSRTSGRNLDVSLRGHGLHVPSDHYFAEWSDVGIHRRVPSDWKTDCQNSAVERASRLDKRSWGNPWSRNIVSIKPRGQPCIMIDAGTAERCNILLNRSASTIIPLFLCSSEGKRRQSPWKRTASALTGHAEAVRVHGMKEKTSYVDKPCKHEYICAQIILAEPLIVTTYRNLSLFSSTMATCWVIVILIHNAQA